MAQKPNTGIDWTNIFEQTPAESQGGLASILAPSGVTPPDPYAGALGAFFSAHPVVITGRYFRKKSISLDGYNFSQCRFDECEFHVTKGNFSFDKCFFQGCNLSFSLDAGRTVQLYNIVATEAWEKGWTAVLPTMDGEGAISIK